MIAALGRAILGLVIDLRVPRALALSAICLSLLSSCDGAVTPPDAGADAGPPPSCADPATRWAFPSPRWEASGGLVVPDQDRAGDAVRSMGWEAELEAAVSYTHLTLPTICSV